MKLNLPNQEPAFVGLDNYIRMFSDALLKTSTWIPSSSPWYLWRWSWCWA